MQQETGVQLSWESICLTYRRSGVRTPQRPPFLENLRNKNYCVFLFLFLHLLDLILSCRYTPVYGIRQKIAPKINEETHKISSFFVCVRHFPPGGFQPHFNDGKDRASSFFIRLSYENSEIVYKLVIYTYILCILVFCLNEINKSN